MRITTIGFGYNKESKNPLTVYVETTIEDWENPSKSLDILRTTVAEEIDLPRQWHDLQGQIRDRRGCLRALESDIKAVEAKLCTLKAAIAPIGDKEDEGDH